MTDIKTQTALFVALGALEHISRFQDQGGEIAKYALIGLNAMLAEPKTAEAEKVQVEEGPWIEYFAENGPDNIPEGLSPEDHVKVRLADGQIITDRARKFSWNRFGGLTVIAYKVIKRAQ
jgi:hypothetical protein